MTTALHQPRISRLCRALLLGSLLFALCSSVGLAQTAEWKERATRYAVIHHPPEVANFAEQLAGMIDPVIEQTAALYDYTPRRPFVVRLHSNAETYGQSSELARTTYGQIVQATAQGAELALAEPRMRNLTPEQLRNLFRRGVAQLMLEELARNKLPIGLLQGAAQYSEHVTPEVEVGMRAVEKAQRDGALLSWSQLNTPARFAAQAEVAAPQSYAVVAFLMDRHGLAAWQRLLAGLRGGAELEAAIVQAYGKSSTTLESDWRTYLGDYFAGAYLTNHFNRFDLNSIRTQFTAGRYPEAGDELTMLAKFIGGAGRTAKENEIRELAKQIEVGLEATTLVNQGQAQISAFQYADAHAALEQARQRYEQLGAANKMAEVDTLMARASSGVTALDQLAQAQRHMTDLRYTEAQSTASAAVKAFADLGDEEHFRQAMTILDTLSTTQVRIAYLVAIIGIVFVAASFWRLRWHAQRQTIPGVLR